MDSSISAKDENWFLRVCHHVSKALYCSVKIAELRVRGTSLKHRFPLFSNYTLVFSSHNDAVDFAGGLTALTNLGDVAIYFVSSVVDFMMTCNSFRLEGHKTPTVV
jgi:hypothetical protein